MSRVECRVEIRIEVDAGCAARAAGPLPSILPPPPELAGDIALEIARLVAQSAHLQRENAQRTQRAEEAVVRVAEDRAVARMHEKASSMGAHALSAGIATAAGGALSVAGATWSIGDASKAGAKASGRCFRLTPRAVEAAGKATSEIGGLIKGFDGAAQARADARITGEQTTAKRAQRAADEAASDVRAARELLERIVAYVREASQTHQATMLACVR